MEKFYFPQWVRRKSVKGLKKLVSIIINYDPSKTRFAFTVQPKASHMVINIYLIVHLNILK